MGIPVFFKHITDKFPNIIKEIQKNNKTTHLFLDFNGLIHPCVNNVLVKYQNKNKKFQNNELEGLFFKEINQYLFKILDIVKPTDLLYIAIDGVAPRAKMIQQRKRRFRSVKEKAKIKEIRKIFNFNNNIIWDTNAITPGTEFMFNLSKYLNNLLIQNKPKELSYCQQIIISDASYPGEGEHKVLQYLKNNLNKNEQNNKYLIYGLDADLIMLSMASRIDNIYLLREAVHFGKINQDKLLLLNIDKLKDSLYEILINKIGIKQLTKTMLIDDYICLCFLIGNDFLPHLPGISIKNEGLETIINIYIKTILKKKECLIFNSNINLMFLKEILFEISKIEDKLVIKQRIEYEKKKYFSRIKGNDIQDQYKSELDKLKFTPLLKPKSLVYKINAGTENWRDRYYYHLFHIRKNYKYIDENIIEICQNYLEGMIWNAKYYFDKCCCWEWNYSYLHSPTLKDLVDNFEMCVDKIDFENKSQKEPVTPFIQLLNVLPPQSSHLLPKRYGQLMINKNSDIYHYYPKKVSLDYYLNIYYHQCEPKLPNIDINLINDTIKKIQLTEYEKLLNKLNN